MMLISRERSESQRRASSYVATSPLLRRKPRWSYLVILNMVISNDDRNTAGFSFVRFPAPLVKSELGNLTSFSWFCQ